MEYKKYKLKKLLTIKNGKDHKKLDDGSYPVYGSGGYMRSVDSFLYDDTSILLPRKGTLSNIQFISETPFWTVDTIYYTVLNENLYDPYYLYLYLNALDLSGYVSRATIPSMTSKTYYSLNIELPEKRIQTKVANMIRAYDKLIENNNKRIHLLEQMTENLYREWFVRFRFPGYEHIKFIDSIPSDWQILRMSDFCYVTDGTHDTPKPVNDGGVPLVTGKCIKNGFIDFNEPYNISYQDHESISKRSGLQTGDILFSNIGTVGTTCLVNYDREFSVKNVIIFKPDNTEISNYLYSWLNSDSIQAIFATQTNGASQQFVGLNFMRRFKILVPNENILALYSDKIKPIRAEIVKLHDINDNLIKQRNMLLPHLMSGKLEV